MNHDIQYLRSYLPRVVVFGPAPSLEDQARAERAVESLAHRLAQLEAENQRLRKDGQHRG